MTGSETADEPPGPGLAGPGALDYANLSGRPAGLFLRSASLVLPGVRRVQAQVPAYAAAWQRASQAALRGAGPLWVALGDSMTLGIGASAYDQGWVGQLGRRLSRDGQRYRIVNLAYSGARVADVAGRQLAALAALAALGQQPDLVTLLIGSNDTMRASHRAALPASYAALLGRLPAGTVVATFGSAHRVAAEVSDLIRKTSAQRGLIVADFQRRGPSSWRGRLADDHFHPNDRGYASMAAVFAAAISGRPELGSPRADA